MIQNYIRDMKGAPPPCDRAGVEERRGKNISREGRPASPVRHINLPNLDRQKEKIKQAAERGNLHVRPGHLSKKMISKGLIIKTGTGEGSWFPVQQKR